MHDTSQHLAKDVFSFRLGLRVPALAQAVGNGCPDALFGLQVPCPVEESLQAADSQRGDIVRQQLDDFTPHASALFGFVEPVIKHDLVRAIRKCVLLDEEQNHLR